MICEEIDKGVSAARPPARLRLAAVAVVRRDVVVVPPDSRVIFFIDTFQMRLLKARQSFSLSLFPL